MSNDTPYMLPVNADANGNPMLDANGIPVVKVYPQANANAGMIPAGYKVGDWIPGADGKPQSEGRAIDPVEIMEKYLKVASGNSLTGRVTLWNGVTLPNHSKFGFPVMQPLCGTIGMDINAYACPRINLELRGSEKQIVSRNE